MHSSDTGIFPEEAIGMLRKKQNRRLINLQRCMMEKPVTRFMPEGRPTEDIIKTAESWNADLIVMGTHGRTGLLHLLLGSIAEHVLRHSKIPVLVVPSKNNQDKSS